MNNSFSIKRTVAYGVKFYTENARVCFYGTVGVFLLLLGNLWFSTPKTYEHMDTAELMFFMWATQLMFLGVILAVQITMQSYYKRLSAVSAYTLPLSTAEKFFFAWFNSLVVYAAGYLLLLCAMVALSQLPMIDLRLGFGIYVQEFFDPEFITSLLLVHATTLLICSVTKGSPLKWYVLTLIGLIATLTILGRITLECGIPSITDLDIPSEGTLHLSGENSWIYCRDISVFSAATTHQLAMAFRMIVVVGLWVAAYLKLGEHEIK